MTPLINDVMLAMSASFAASILAKATGITTLALLTSWLARKSRAAVRHVVLAAAFAVLLALPIASVVAPPLRVEVPVAATAGAESATFSPSLDTILLIDPIESSAAGAPAGAASSRLSPSTVLLALWALGAALFLLPVVVGVWQTHALRRSGIPWRQGQSIVAALARDAGIKRRVDVLLHESMAGPMTCGVVQPAIVLPMDAPAWAEADLRRAIVHELEHVRRGDWVSQCLARIVCASYWFHPLVWVAWRRLSLEAERACDDAVLRRAEATDYADQLLVLAERLSISPNPPLLAMANRHDLATRVVAVLDTHQRRGRAGARWVGVACAASGLIVTTMSPLRIVAAARTQSGATQAATRPASVAAATQFEVASIKPCKTEDVMPQTRSGGRGGGPGTYSTSPGRLNIPCLNLEELIRLAYVGFGAAPGERLLNSSPARAPIRGGPAWVRSGSDKYGIEAKAEGDPDKRQIMGPMLRSLLEARFQLKIHREREEAPMYALTIAKGGLRVQPMKDGDCSTDPPPQRGLLPGEKPPCGSLMMMGGRGTRILTFSGTTLSDFARSLSAGMDRYVIDRTETPGQFILRLEYAQDENTPNMPFGTPIRREPAADDPPGVSILTALQEQLGLKLEPIKGPREVIVIDRVERPSPNSAAIVDIPSRGRTGR